MSVYIIPTDTCYGLACPISEHESYDKIYKMKKRDYTKPLAIMVEDFKWLSQNTDLTPEQIQFLKDYENPFTILTESMPLSHWIQFEVEDVCFRNREVYPKIAIRIANNTEQAKLIKRVGPIFLTSANISDKPEIYKGSELKTEFAYYLANSKIELLGGYDLTYNNHTSDIFEFEGTTTEIKYLRKNKEES
ncbi:Sua5/YciO/YrdC/YwlC family protein [Candidatus Gracilibacteria bacterium 28_42_T64]|nr:Sua5/YciO/YrdC/YwlC family protein [Candidatus Gracilibacteria bacterium 28_42_T64]